MDAPAIVLCRDILGAALELEDDIARELLDTGATQSPVLGSMTLPKAAHCCGVALTH